MRARTRLMGRLAVCLVTMAIALAALAELAAQPVGALSLGPAAAGAASAPVAWTLPANAVGAPNGSCASNSLGNTVLSLHTFGLAVPLDAQIRGVQVLLSSAAARQTLSVYLKRPDGRVSR